MVLGLSLVYRQVLAYRSSIGGCWPIAFLWLVLALLPFYRMVLAYHSSLDTPIIGVLALSLFYRMVLAYHSSLDTPIIGVLALSLFYRMVLVYRFSQDGVGPIALQSVEGVKHSNVSSKYSLLK
eukprot:TRINITY_DN7694_c0_g1_i6.p1 TRINITY_DN7694_c0_g1~~TRINITY_DN7694_c0_g1_i6.p1  ORF type:complete len:124 (-),score=4.70 TRINITY_DN7694_c0_g1_i6:176-547(-)